jgi:DNA-binding NarL/FixJ family response regulator
MSITIGVVDDEQLFVKALSTLIDLIPPFKVILDALDGEELLNRLSIAPTLPDILLIDVNMKPMDGPRVARQIREKYPLIRMSALSTRDDDATVIRMIKSGCCAYLSKDIHPDDLEKALLEIYEKGYYNADVININYRRLLQHSQKEDPLTEREKTFLQLACSELSYKQVAAEMYLSERTIDGYRESVFQKLNVQSRVGMVLEAIRRNLVSL